MTFKARGQIWLKILGLIPPLWYFLNLGMTLDFSIYLKLGTVPQMIEQIIILNRI